MATVIHQTAPIPVPKTSRFKARSYSGDYMKIGKLGQDIVIDYFRAHPDVIEVDDLTQLCEIQRTDMDIVIRMKDGTNPIAEIKWDRHLGKTSNVLVEVLRFNHKAPQEVAGVLGWTMRTEARWIIYYAPRFGYAYQFKTDTLRKCFQAYTGKKRGETELVWINTDSIKSTLCILLPLTECKGAFQVLDLSESTRKYWPGFDKYRLQFAPEPLQF